MFLVTQLLIAVIWTRPRSRLVQTSEACMCRTVFKGSYVHRLSRMDAGVKLLAHGVGKICKCGWQQGRQGVHIAFHGFLGSCCSCAFNLVRNWNAAVGFALEWLNGFHEIWYWAVFLKSLDTFQFWLSQISNIRHIKWRMIGVAAVAIACLPGAAASLCFAWTNRMDQVPSVLSW